METREQAAGPTPLRAIKLTGRITTDHRLEVDLPLDVRAGEAEVIILITAAPSPSAEDRAGWLKEMEAFRRKIGPIHPPVSEAVIEEREASEY
ncbi:MAG: hypothetical protein HY718_05405 [Planctomycetes bacterium]|nr:hypothetical protein [Planctomycetota bacterium]